MDLKFDGILFDFDGTFADTGEGIFKSIKKMLKDMNKPQITNEQLKIFIGPPLADSLKSVCGFNDDEVAQAIKIYRSHYSSGDYKILRIYDGIIPLIEELKKLGIKTAIASSKPEIFLIKTLEHLGLENLFDAVVGIGEGAVFANKFAIIQKALDKAGLKDKERVLMVGDRRFDVLGAKTVGIRSVGVLFGYGSEKELKDEGADYIVENVEQLRNIILK
ncbi:MAG TPA: HAD hydrolase-like protein [Clostridia bacterium]|nr:HAD hydrolase-like protein [Clostridia bacterium]